MKNDWLTIPDAPQYEINSDLVVRNKLTGKTLTPIRLKRKNGVTLTYTLHGYGVYLYRTGQSLRRQAQAVQGSFAPIPSLDGRYEINAQGVVRNTRTKKVIKVDHKRHHQAYLKDENGRNFARAIADMLWEVHGIIKPRGPKPAPVVIDNGHQRFYFESKQAAAKFLAPKLHYKWETIAHYMHHFRKPKIGDWNVTYLTSETAELAKDIPWCARSLAALANRQAKLDSEVGLTC